MPDPVSAMMGLAGGASLLSGFMGSKSASDAANAQVAASDRASQLQYEMYLQSRKEMLPWMQAGGRALGNLESAIKAGPGEFTQSPGYQFRLAEGEKALMRQRAAMGNVASGSTGKALQRYGQDYASNEYDKFLSRYYDRLKPLQSLAGVGQTTATNIGQQGMATGQIMGNYGMQAGNARAGGYINSSNAWTDAMQGGVNAIGSSMGQDVIWQIYRH